MSFLLKSILSVTGPRTVARFDAACRDPMAAQRALLERIVRANQATLFGSRHDFASVTSLADYRRRVPISTYETLEPYVKASMEGAPAQLTAAQPVLFASTSGTTGQPKYLPVTIEKRKSISARTRVWISALYRDHPDAFDGRIMSIVSPEVESFSPCGIPIGAESGHTYRTLPRVMKARYSCPDAAFGIADYEAKYYTILRIAASQSVTLLCSVNPSTIVLIGERLAEHTERIIRDVRDGTLCQAFAVEPALRSELVGRFRPDPGRARFLEAVAARGGGALKPRHTWPGLAAIGCWKGGSVGMYLSRFDRYYRKDIPVRDLGYLSSEHQGSVPLSDEGDDGVLDVKGNVYEFRPAEEEPDPEGRSLLTLEDLEIGKRYFVYATTCGGLYRYDMNDILEVTGRYERTPTIRFVQKGKGIVSFTGEKLHEAQVVEAVSSAFRELDGGYEFIAAVGESRRERPRYTFLFEFDEDPSRDSLRRCLQQLDRGICALNLEYASKRHSRRIGAPALRIVRRGEFDRYRRRMVERGRPDGQFKILRLTSDESFGLEFSARELLESPAESAAHPAE